MVLSPTGESCGINKNMGNELYQHIPPEKTIYSAHVEDRQMSMSVWMATEGGSRCPLCGKFAKSGQLGNLSYTIVQPTEWSAIGLGYTWMHKPNFIHVSAYGHLPGKGCNR